MSPFGTTWAYVLFCNTAG